MASSTNDTSHDLKDFMQSATKQMQEEYIRIQKRVKQDPGTAGDQGEENWAALLRNWLPHTLHIVTKGQIIGHDGKTTPQLDIIILRPEYPPHLLDKKLYIAGGVLAVFECKITLRKSHLSKIFNTCASVKGVSYNKVGTLRDDLCSPIIYGVLAHSSEWSSELPEIKASQPNLIETPDNEQLISKHLDQCQKLSEVLFKIERELNTSPINMIDLICVADLTSFSYAKTLLADSDLIEGAFMRNQYYNLISSHSTIYSEAKKYSISYPIGALFSSLLRKLSWQLEGLRNISTYFEKTGLRGAAKGVVMLWPITILSKETLGKLETHIVKDAADKWNNWHYRIDD